MQTLPSNATDRTNVFQKLIAFIIMGGAIWGGIKLFNYLVPDVLLAIRNLWMLIGLGLPLALILIYVISNPLVVWGFFKTLSWKLTSFLIKMDPLSVMDRYADYLSIKLKNLNTTRITLSGKKEKLKRLLQQLNETIEDNLKKGAAAQKVGETNVASIAGNAVIIDRQTLGSYTPIYQKMEANVKFLDELSENWDTSIQKLRYTIDRKRTEFENLKEMANALGQASEFASGDTDASRLYNESVKQLEEQVGQKIAYIDDFEKKSKGILAGMKVEKQMQTDEGLQAIEDYKHSGDLFIPDFSNSIPLTQVVSETPGVTKYKFLK